MRSLGYAVFLKKHKINFEIQMLTNLGIAFFLNAKTKVI